MPGGVLATSGEVGKASEEACGVLTVSNKIAPAAPKRRARGGKASRARAGSRTSGSTRLRHLRLLLRSSGSSSPTASCVSNARLCATAREPGLGAHARRPREDRRGGAERVEVWRSLLAVTSSPQLPTA